MQNIAQPDLNIIDIADLKPLPYVDSCITIGNFDGVHLGHQAIIKRMLKSVQHQPHPLLVVTFYPNPYVYFNQPKRAFYLSTPNEKARFLMGLGVDEVITFRFDSAFANLTAEAFLLKLKHALGLGTLIVGQDFALGKGREGTIPVLKEIGRVHNFAVETIPYIAIGKEEISSTTIRQYLDQGMVDGAAELLGHPYSLTGEVSHGADRGARIGLPTANITHWPHKKLPLVGVYATRVHLRGQVYQGVTNVGYRPTFEDQNQVKVETHILDFDDNIYGETIRLDFLMKLRDEQKFSGIDAFLAQIERDKAKARRIFADAEK